MLTEGQQFFLLFIALYLSECVLWVKRRAWVFITGRRWHAKPPLMGEGNRLVFVPPLFPLRWGFVSGEFSHLSTNLDVSAVPLALNEFHKATHLLTWVAQWLVAPVFFCALPVAYWASGASLVFWGILGVAWCLLLITARQFYLAHRRLYPPQRGERWQHVFLIALVPQHALRATGLLARHWLQHFHPLAVAAAVLDRTSFTALASKLWREACFPQPVTGERPLPAPSSLSPDDLAQFLCQQGLETPQLLAPPTQSDDALAYCPRCHAQFQVATSQCPDCGGLAVVPFVTPAAGKEKNGEAARVS